MMVRRISVLVLGALVLMLGAVTAPAGALPAKAAPKGAKARPAGLSAPASVSIGSVTGHMHSTAGPVAGVYFGVSDAVVPAIIAYAATDANGDFTISGLPAGTYRGLSLDLAVFASPNHYIPQFYDHGGSTLPDFATATDFVVTDAATTTLNTIELTYATPGTITGTVDDGSSPLPGMYVLVSGATIPEVAAYAVTGIDGSFTVSGLAPGAYKALIIDPANFSSPSYFVAEFYDNGGITLPDFVTATTITVTPAAATALNPVSLDHTP